MPSDFISDAYIAFYVAIDVIALASTLLVFYGCWKSRDSINLALKLIVFLCIFDCIIALENAGEGMIIYSEFTCQLHSFIRLLASYLSLTWAFSMSLIAFLILTDVRRNVTRLFYLVLFGSILVSVFLAIRPFIGLSAYSYKFVEELDQKGQIEDSYCESFPSEDMSLNDLIWMFCFEQFLPYSLGILATLLAFLRGNSYFGRRPSNELVIITNAEGLKLIRYPFVQLLVYTPRMIASFYTLLGSNETIFLLTFLLKNMYCLGGLLTYILYRKQFQKRPQKLDLGEISMQLHEDSFEEEDFAQL